MRMSVFPSVLFFFIAPQRVICLGTCPDKSCERSLRTNFSATCHNGIAADAVSPADAARGMLNGACRGLAEVTLRSEALALQANVDTLASVCRRSAQLAGVQFTSRAPTEETFMPDWTAGEEYGEYEADEDLHEHLHEHPDGELQCAGYMQSL